MADPANRSAASSDLFDLTLVTPSGNRVDLKVRSVRAPGIDGDFGVLRGHIPFMTALRIGPLIVETETGKQFWAISGGFAEVLQNRVTILAEAAERSDQIDVDRAVAARKRAAERLANKNAGDIDESRANASLARAINRIRIASGL